MPVSYTHLEEGGILGLKQEGRAYEIEQKYSESPEELFHISCLSRRPERFYEFYREEILKKIPDMKMCIRDRYGCRRMAISPRGRYLRHQ